MSIQAILSFRQYIDTFFSEIALVLLYYDHQIRTAIFYITFLFRKITIAMRGIPCSTLLG